MTVSFDGNFRSALWSWEEARDFCTLCLPYVDVLFGIEPYHLWKKEENHEDGDVKDGIPFQPDYEEQEKVFWPLRKDIRISDVLQDMSVLHTAAAKTALWPICG